MPPPRVNETGIVRAVFAGANINRSHFGRKRRGNARTFLGKKDIKISFTQTQSAVFRTVNRREEIFWVVVVSRKIKNFLRLFTAIPDQVGRKVYGKNQRPILVFYLYSGVFYELSILIKK